MLKRLAASMAAIACMAGMVFAQEDLIRPVQGARYIGAGGHWTTMNGDNSYAIDVNFGYFFTNRVVGEAVFGYTGTDSDWEYSVQLKGKYLLTENSPLTPYLAAGGIYTKDDLGNSDTTWLAGGGFDYFIKPTQSFFVDLTAYKPDSFDEWIFVTTFGFRMYFK